MSKRVLDGVPIKTDKTGKFCALSCVLLQYDNGTVCGLERSSPRRHCRYDTVAQMHRRCPTCLRLERKAR
jgi:hypothetical protein